MSRPARPVLLMLVGAAVSVAVACGLEVAGSGPPLASEPAADGGKTVVEDAAAFDGDATQGGCNDGRTICSDKCTDTTADPANCGGCGRACGVGQTCNEGTCDVLCVGDTVRCSGVCVDPSTDPSNCGACGNACTGGKVCVAKACVDDCAAGQTRCSPDAGIDADAGGLTYCATLQTDRKNCGSCGHVCTTSQSCVGATCKDLCVSPARVGDVFSPTMVGCADKKDWNHRAEICPPGSKVCSAAQWNARPAGPAPTFNYWTDDYLQWLGSSQSCAAVPNGSGYACYGDPMRVCGKQTDANGNTCNYTNCGYNAALPNRYYGGCQGDVTAGALCCTL